MANLPGAVVVRFFVSCLPPSILPERKTAENPALRDAKVTGTMSRFLRFLFRFVWRRIFFTMRPRAPSGTQICKTAWLALEAVGWPPAGYAAAAAS
jgi:hypothetical protein